MAQYIQFPTADGGTILVEVEEPEGAVVPAARAGGVPEKARQTFEAAMERIRPVAGTLIAKLRGLHDPPDEVEVEFGLKMSAEAGAVVAAAGAEANYKVTLTWKREQKKDEKKS